MIQLNLLPDVKLEYIAAQRSRRLVLSVAIIVAGLSLALMIVLFGFGQLQKKHISDLSGDITEISQKLQGKKNINDILTVQNQLNSITALHAAKPASTRLFTYLNQITPANISISSYTSDFTTQTATITGNSDTLSSVNTYVDTLKFTTYRVKGSTTDVKAFPSVVLSSFGLSTGSKDTLKAATYSIKVTYDKAIYDIAQKIELTVPSKVTTRSQLAQPTDLFTTSPTPTTSPSTTTSNPTSTTPAVKGSN